MSNVIRSGEAAQASGSKTARTENGEISFFQAVIRMMSAKVSERSQDIIRARFGLDGQAPKTLESIGKKYGITRERVRQIIRGVVRDMDTAKNASTVRRIGDLVVSTLKGHHGIMTEEALYGELSRKDAREAGALRFFVENFIPLQEVKESRECRQAFASKDFPLERWKAVIAKVSATLAEQGHSLTDDELRSSVTADPDFSDSGEELFDFLAVSKEVKRSVFGFWGFVRWSDIEPKGAREKAYLVLKAERKPLHFREIAALIDKYSLQKRGRKTHHQTVHNELIKDKRFVLVGRGTYALSEWGYKRGTVREILTEILDKAGTPLERKDILDQVAKVRQVKRSTVIINLNTFFSRVGKSTYTVRK